MSSPQPFLLSFNVKCYLLFWDIYVLLIVSCLSLVTYQGRNLRGEGEGFTWPILKTEKINLITEFSNGLNVHCD